PRAVWRKGVALAGAAAAVTLHAWIGYLALVACTALLGPRALTRTSPIVPLTAIVILLTAAVHAVFFGSGRYRLAVVPFLAALAFAPVGAERITGRGGGEESRD